jgi:probable rRNA maturation factor
VSVIINNVAERTLPEGLVARLKKAAELLLREYNLEQAEVGIILTDNAYLQRLNAAYRGLDKPTDVLSFGLMEPGQQPAGDEPEPALGDIYISLDLAAEQAAAAGHSLAREIMLLAVHGMLHLLGFDHAEPAEQKAMQEKERAVLRLVDKV